MESISRIDDKRPADYKEKFKAQIDQSKDDDTLILISVTSTGEAIKGNMQATNVTLLSISTAIMQLAQYIDKLKEENQDAPDARL